MFILAFLIFFNLSVVKTKHESSSESDNGLELPGGESISKESEPYESESDEENGEGLSIESQPVKNILRKGNPEPSNILKDIVQSTLEKISEEEDSEEIYINILKKQRNYVKLLKTINKPGKTATPPPSGPFYNLVVNICNVTLTRLSTRTTTKFIRILQRHLKGIGFGYMMRKTMKEFVKTLKKIAEFRGALVKRFVLNFLEYILERSKGKDKFFRILNSIYSVYEDIRFDHYVYDLKRFGDGRIGSTSLNGKTKDLISKIVLRRYHAQEESVKDEIKSSFDLLMSEFHERQSKGKLLG